MSKRQHISRLAAPKSWPIPRKTSKWITKSLPGAHSFEKSMPLVVVLRDILKTASTAKEIKTLLNAGQILVNSRKIRETKFAVGLLDVISIQPLKEHYRVVINKQGKLSFIKIPESEANVSLLKIQNKKSLAKGKTQLNFGNGWNIIVGKDEYKTNDVVVFDTKTCKIKEVIPLKNGAMVYIVGGRHTGFVAKLTGIRETGTLKKHKIATVSAGETEMEGAVENMIAVGTAKPIIKLE